MPSAGAIRAGRAFVELLIDDDRLQQGLRRAQRQINPPSDRLRTAASAAIFAKTGDTLDKMSARTGIAVESLAALEFAATRSGASLDDVEKGSRRLSQAIRDGTRGLRTYTDAFDELGVSADELAKLSPEQQFAAIADALAGVTDDSRRTALAIQLLGRSGTRLIPLLVQGSAGLEEFRREAERLGIVLSTRDATAAAQFTDALGDLRLQVRAIAFQVGGALAPALTEAAQRIGPIVGQVIDWVRENGALVRTVAAVAAGLTVAGVAVTAFGVGAIVVSAAIGGLATLAGVAATALGAIGAVAGFLITPLGLVAAAVVGVSVALIDWNRVASFAVNELSGTFRNLFATVSEVVGAIVDALGRGDILAAAELLFVSLELVWANGFATLMGLWVEFWNEIKSTAIAAGAELEKLAITLGTRVGAAIADAFGNEGAAALIRSLEEGARNQVDRDAETAIEVLDRQSRLEMKRLQDEKDEAERRLDELLKDRESFVGPRQGFGSPNLGSLLDDLGAVAQETRRFAAQGVFGAQGGRALAGTSGTAERTANATEQAAESLKRIQREIESGGAVFA